MQSLPTPGRLIQFKAILKKMSTVHLVMFIIHGNKVQTMFYLQNIFPKLIKALADNVTCMVLTFPTVYAAGPLVKGSIRFGWI